MNRKEMLARLKKGEDPLEISIAKWEDLAKGKNMGKYGSINCALCYLYDKNDCNGCVIAEAGYEGCLGTPYEEYYDAYEDADEDTLKAIAQKEVEFLKSLRKKKAKP